MGERLYGSVRAKRAEFDVAVAVGCKRHFGGVYGCPACDEIPIGKAKRLGYVAENFAARKGQYFWEFTHLPTGMRLIMPVAGNYHIIETKARAMNVLEELVLGTLDLSKQYEGLGWGGVRIP